MNPAIVVDRQDKAIRFFPCDHPAARLTSVAVNNSNEVVTAGFQWLYP